jgi:hypothetical protein
VIDAVASDYQDSVRFIAVAGRSDLEPTKQRAAELLRNGTVDWGFDQSIWELYGILGQPASVMIRNGVIVDSWYGALGETELRNRLDSLTSG